MPNFYRYQFSDTVDIENIRSTLDLALVSVEALHGDAAMRIDAAYQCHNEQRIVVIDGSTEIGRDLNRVFAGYLLRELESNEFEIDRMVQGPTTMGGTV